MERKLFVRTVGAGALAALAGGVEGAEAEEVLAAGPGDGTLSVRPGDALVVRLDPEYLMTNADLERFVAQLHEIIGSDVDVLVCSGVVGLDVVRREEMAGPVDLERRYAERVEDLLRLLRHRLQAEARIGGNPIVTR